MGFKMRELIVLKVVIFFAFSAIGEKVQLFEDSSYLRLRWEGIPTEACFNLPSDKKGNVYSVVTDTCVIAYWSDNCGGYYSRKYIPGRTSTPKSGLNINSLQKCNNHEGGLQLNVDITTHFTTLSTNPNILESYSDVCSCIDVPRYVQDMAKWSINNHHNGLFAYFEPDCNEYFSKALYIHAGLWYNSKDMHKQTRIYRGTIMKIQSFGPAPNTTYFQQSCSLYSNDKIMEYELVDLNKSSPTSTAIVLHETSTDLTTGANEDLIHFFAENGYQGFHFGSRSTSKCNNFPNLIQHRWVNGVGSIKTRTCVILYSTDDCVGRSVKIEVPGSPNLTSVWESTVKGEQTLSSLYTQKPNWKWETKSYHVCNKYTGGPSLNVDIVSSDPDVGLLNGPAIIESYRNLCTCRNVPQYVQQLKWWSIENNGNTLIAYFTPDCFSSNSTPSPLFVPAGHSSFSFGLGLFKEISSRNGGIYKIQSFGPDPNSEYFKRSCNRNCTGSMCEFDTKTDMDGPIVKRMRKNKMKLQVLIEKFQNFSRQVNEIGPMHEEAAIKLESAKNDLNNKLQEQINEMQFMIDSMASHIE